MLEDIMNIVVVGHVDHGKSTVIGHLLADTGSLPKGKLEAIRENCKRNSKPFEYAFLLDALKNEQSQGITIDTCRCFFQTEKRRYIIIDAPGHIEFLKNMVTGASRAASTEKRMTPSAQSASRRATPRSCPCRSSSSPWAVWGKHWALVHSAWAYRLYSSAATA